MASKNLMEFEQAMKYMEPMEVNDYLQKTLDFLKRNNSEVYFPSISPYVEGFLVNLVTDTRNLKSKAFKYQDRVLAEEIIKVLEMSREVFRWTHAYENGNLLVYKKMFSNKIKKKPVKLSTIADRLIQARASALQRHTAHPRAPLPHDLRQPHTRAPLPHEPATMQPHSHASPLRPPNVPEEPIGTFKVRFLDKTLRFIKSTQTKLSYEEMHLSQAEYIYNLLKYRDKDVGFGYKSLYAPLWEAMEGCGDCKFEVTLKETSGRETAALLLEKVPKNGNKSKKDKEKPNNKVSEKKNKDETHKTKNVSNSPHKENKDSNIQTDQSLAHSFLDPYYPDAATTIPSLRLLSNITEKFFTKTVVALTEFADNENSKMKTFSQLSEGEVEFVKEVLSLAETISVRDMFMPKYRILLWKLDRVVKEARKAYELTYTVIEKDRSITWIKMQKSAGALSTSPDNESSALPPLELLTNITEPFFKQTIIRLTEFADDARFVSRTFRQLKEEEIFFIKNIRQLAGSTKVRELFDPHYRDLLWRLNYSINEAANICKITTSVNDKERSITLKKTPKFATPAPVPPKVQPNVATGARSKSMVPMKTRERSLSRDRLIQFEKGGKPTTDIIDLTTDKESMQERGRSMSRRTAKLLEDLSTPVESDIGMRMMMMMGWRGGALGARGDGIMEPVMPNIDQPKRGGLGHVPPPKLVPRKPIDFRLMLLHNLLDFLLHDEWKKEIVFKEPLVERERKFLHCLLTSVNGRHNIQLTEKENEYIARIYTRLADYPTMELRGDISKDLKTVTLQKLLDRPLRALNIKIPKPKPLQSQPQPQPSPTAPKAKAAVDVVITKADVSRVIPLIDITQMEVAATPQAIRKRALRLVFLTKLAEALSWDWWDQITFKYEEGGIAMPIRTFFLSVVVHLNNRDRCLNLYGAEAPVFEAMLGALLEAKGARGLAVEFKPPSKLILSRTRFVKEESLPNNFAKLKVSDKNNDSNVKSNSNQDVNMIDNIKKAPNEKETSKELNTTNVIENVDNSKINGIARDDLKDTASAIDVNIKENIINKKSAKSDGLDENNIQAIDNKPKVITGKEVDMDVNNNKDDYLTQERNENALGRTSPGTNNVENKTVDKHKSNVTIENGNLKDIKVECDNNLVESTETKIEGLEIKIETDDNVERNEDKGNYILMNIEEIKKERTDFESDNLNIAGLSDLDKDIRDLEMTILNAEAVACHVKTENDSNDGASDLEMAISETDLSFIIKQENDDSNISGKRSHSNSICSQELDPKKTKINTESDENVVIIKPKKPDEIMTEDMIKEVQTVMAKELDKPAQRHSKSTLHKQQHS
ncbi:uncharacterized protein LOC134802675 [Cydia splendana]|uniref:uncharacterized protein LOC134802675 n=1 Tax=Cydia splendana TaxID=1100963 RepID=UPI00300D2975